MKRGDLNRNTPPPVRPGGELTRMAAPLLGLIGFILRIYHWPIMLLVVLYLCSGLTSVAPGEQAMVLRFGRLVGDTPGQQVHGAGFLFALPRPIDEVIRVDVKKVQTVQIRDLWNGSGRATNPAAVSEGAPQAIRSSRSFATTDTIDPEQDGYCLTGDDYVLQAVMVARYRVQDPVTYALKVSDPEQVLRQVICSTMTRCVGELGIQEIMGEGRRLLSERVRSLAQEQFDATGMGMELLAVEFEKLEPPYQVLPSFRNVVTTMIDAVTLLQQAYQYRDTEIPTAEARPSTKIAQARAKAAQKVATARGEAEAFKALYEEYRQRPELVRERLYREMLESALEPASKRFIPPPANDRYTDFRLSIPN